VLCIGELPKMVVREVVAVADARQVIMLMLSIGMLRVVVVGVGQLGHRPQTRAVQLPERVSHGLCRVNASIVISGPAAMLRERLSRRTT
jgi:hypothetical protein